MSSNTTDNNNTLAKASRKRQRASPADVLNPPTPVNGRNKRVKTTHRASTGAGDLGYMPSRKANTKATGFVKTLAGKRGRRKTVDVTYFPEDDGQEGDEVMEDEHSEGPIEEEVEQAVDETLQAQQFHLKARDTSMISTLQEHDEKHMPEISATTSNRFHSSSEHDEHTQHTVSERYMIDSSPPGDDASVGAFGGSQDEWPSPFSRSPHTFSSLPRTRSPSISRTSASATPGPMRRQPRSDFATPESEDSSETVDERTWRTGGQQLLSELVQSVVRNHDYAQAEKLLASKNGAQQQAQAQIQPPTNTVDTSAQQTSTNITAPNPTIRIRALPSAPSTIGGKIVYGALGLGAAAVTWYGISLTGVSFGANEFIAAAAAEPGEVLDPQRVLLWAINGVLE